MNDILSLDPSGLDDDSLTLRPGLLDALCSSEPLAKAGCVDIPLRKLHDFKSHAFKVIHDKDMDALVASVKEEGIHTPLIVRKDGDGYEIISGHRRRDAAMVLKMEKVPCIIVDYNDEEASLCMCNCNLQRTKLYPSERANYVYIKYHILEKRRAYGDGRSVRLIAKEFGMSPKSIQRCLNLYDLGPQLMELVDEKKISETLAVAKVYPMRKSTREMIYDGIIEYNISFDERCLDIILEADRKGVLSQEDFDCIVSRCAEEAEKRKENKKIASRYSLPVWMTRYFPSSYTDIQIEEKVSRLLEKYKNDLDEI